MLLLTVTYIYKTTLYRYDISNGDNYGIFKTISR